MCGRYALGAAHIDFLEGLQGQYARLFPGRRGDDGRVRGGGPQRLRGGGAGGDSANDEEAVIEKSETEKPTQPVAEKMGIKWEREQDFWPSYNIAPRQRAPVVRRDPSNGEAMIETMQWGLIPHWTKFPPTGALNTINARSESLIDASSGGMWHALKGYKRCVIPAQGYYEWQKKGSTKVAHFTRLAADDASAPPILFFAGLWDTVTYAEPVPSKFVPAEGDDREPYPTGNPVPLSTFTILTTTPSPDIAWLHDRMPCILTDEDEIARWLDLGEVHGWEEGKGGTADLLHSFRGLTAYPVVPEVGKIGHSQQNYILPVAERRDGIKSFFQKQAKPKEEDKPKEEVQVAENEVKAERHKKTDFNVPDVVDVNDEKKEDLSGDEKKVEKLEPEDVQEPSSQKSHGSRSPTTPKRKREEDRSGGRKTKVVRQEPKDEKKDQPAITNFFKSPKKPKT